MRPRARQPQRVPTAAYDQQFIERTRFARERAGYSQTEIAKLLDIPQDRYKQYETRSKLPYQFVERFTLACRISIEWLMTGKERMPLSGSIDHLSQSPIRGE